MNRISTVLFYKNRDCETAVQPNRWPAMIRISITALVVVSGLACSVNRGSPNAPLDHSEAQVSTVCDSLGDHLGRFGFEWSSAAASDSCGIDAVLELSTVTLEVDPLEDMRDSLQDQGWAEGLEFAADGPGTTSFRLFRDGRYCQIDGGAPAWIDDNDEIRQSDEYAVRVACRSEP